MSNQRTPAFHGLLISDFDGTLSHGSAGVSRRCRDTLAGLRKDGVCVAVATGRNLQSAKHAMEPEFPIDYLIFSSGCGVVDWSTQTLLKKTSFAPHEKKLLVEVALELAVTFTLHAETPDNHRFTFSGQDPHPPDLHAMLEKMAAWVETWENAAAWTISQSLWILREFSEAVLERVRARLHPLEVVRTTSPLDHRTTWIEIFPAGVSKATGSAWLRDFLGIAHEKTFALGNDYNDLSLLRWANTARVVANAPAELRKEFGEVPGVDCDGAVHAIENWFQKSKNRIAG